MSGKCSASRVETQKNDYPLSSGNHCTKFGNYRANGSI